MFYPPLGARLQADRASQPNARGHAGIAGRRPGAPNAACATTFTCLTPPLARGIPVSLGAAGGRWGRASSRGYRVRAMTPALGGGGIGCRGGSPGLSIGTDSARDSSATMAGHDTDMMEVGDVQGWMARLTAATTLPGYIQARSGPCRKNTSYISGQNGSLSLTVGGPCSSAHLPSSLQLHPPYHLLCLYSATVLLSIAIA